MRIWSCLLIVVALPVWAEGACFRTAAGAAAQSEGASQAGVRDGEGFRLEGVRTDRLGGGRWAMLRWCAHPERPGVVVKLSNDSVPAAHLAGAPTIARQPITAIQPAIAARPDVMAGSEVRVVSTDAMVRMEMAGVAQANGVRGETVRVRLGSAGEPRFVEAVVRDAGQVELEGSR